MLTEATKAGFFDTAFGRFPKLQILTIADLYAGKQPKLPPRDSGTFRKATREDLSAKRQDSLL